jgi:HAD superfamily hydrolase (TIGR01509 family)
VKKKICLFDWGGVIETSHIEYTTIRDCLYSLGYYNIHASAVWDEFHVKESFSQFDSVKTEEELDKVLKHYLSRFSDEVTDEDVEKYKSIYRKLMIDNPYYKEVSEYIYSLKDKCEIGLLSNASLLDKSRQDSHINYDMLDYKFLSYELGMVKPNKEIYEYVNNVLKDYDILFLDDKEINLEVPKSLGWNTYLVKPGGDLTGIKKACEEFLERG